MDGWTEGEIIRLLLVTVEFQGPTDKCEMMELENHHFATITGKIEVNKNYQWILNPGQVKKNNRIFAWS